MKEGKVVETGLTSNVLDHPAHLYTQELVEAIPGRRFVTHLETATPTPAALTS
jgi:peptide/nickel transport system ATP-binding protein